MDCRLQARMKEMVEALAREHQQELAAAGTLVDLEELTCQLGRGHATFAGKGAGSAGSGASPSPRRVSELRAELPARWG